MGRHGGPRGLQVRPGGGYGGPCVVRRRCNLVKAGVRAPCFLLGHLGNAFSSHKPLSVSHLCCSSPCKQSAELSQLVTPAVGPIYLLTVKSHLTLKYRSAARDMLGREECEGWRINQTFWKRQLWQ